MQIISNDKTVRKDTIQNIKEINNQSLATQAEKNEQLMSMKLAIEKTFDLMSNDKVDLSTVNDALKNKIGPYDQKWLEETKAKLLKQIDDEKRAILIMSRKKNK